MKKKKKRGQMAASNYEEEEEMTKEKEILRNCLPVPDSVMETEIIPRLNLKSKFRLRWVNKYLYGLVSGHLRHRYGSLPGKAVGLFFSEPIQLYYGSYLYDLVGDEDNCIEEIGNDERTTPIYICGCCNGLILFLNVCRHLYVCNPLTRRSVKIPDPDPPRKRSWPLPATRTYSALAFDPLISGRSYNVLCFLNNPSTVYIFSSVTGTWVSTLVPDVLRFHERIPPFYFRGKVHHVGSTNTSPHIVLVFHRDTGYLIREIKLPPDQSGTSTYAQNCQLLGHSGGRLRYAVIRNQEMVVWDLEDGCVWVLKHSVRFEDICGPLFPFRFGSPERLFITQFHPDKDLVFLGLVENSLFSYDMMNANLVYLRFFLMLYQHQHAFAYSPYFSDDMDL